MDVKQLEELGDNLRRLGHDRRKVVEEIVANTRQGSEQAKVFYRDLDRISEQAINLMQRQRSMIKEELSEQGQL